MKRIISLLILVGILSTIILETTFAIPIANNKLYKGHINVLFKSRLSWNRTFFAGNEIDNKNPTDPNTDRFNLFLPAVRFNHYGEFFNRFYYLFTVAADGIGRSSSGFITFDDNSSISFLYAFVGLKLGNDKFTHKVATGKLFPKYGYYNSPAKQLFPTIPPSAFYFFPEQGALGVEYELSSKTFKWAVTIQEAQTDLGISADTTISGRTISTRAEFALGGKLYNQAGSLVGKKGFEHALSVELAGWGFSKPRLGGLGYALVPISGGTPSGGPVSATIDQALAASVDDAGNGDIVIEIGRAVRSRWATGIEYGLHFNGLTLQNKFKIGKELPIANLGIARLIANGADANTLNESFQDSLGLLYELQAAYAIPFNNKGAGVEFAFRYNYINAILDFDEENYPYGLGIGGSVSDVPGSGNTFSIGMNFYIVSHASKIQLEYTRYTSEGAPEGEDRSRANIVRWEYQSTF